MGGIRSDKIWQHTFQIHNISISRNRVSVPESFLLN